jgi:hypothetical protein
MDLNGQLIGTDFVAFYTAGEILNMGQSAQLYDLELAHQIQQPLYGQSSDNFNPYLNPPFYAWLFMPFARLPYPTSPLLWMGMNLVFLWFSIKLIVPKNALFVFLLALTWQPSFAAISFGQNAFLSLLILTAVFCLQQKDRRFTAGLVSGLLLYKPQLLIGVCFFWLLDFRRYWKTFAGITMTGSFLLGSSFLLMPEALESYLFYARNVASNLMSVPGFPIWNAHSVQSFWLGIFPGKVTLAFMLHIGLVIGGIWLLLQSRHTIGKNHAAGYGMAICLTVWITPYIMIYDWVLLLIPAVILWKEYPKLRKFLQVTYAVFWVTMFLSSVLTFAQWTLFERAIQISVPVFAIMMVLLYRFLVRIIKIKEQLPGE